MIKHVDVIVGLAWGDEGKGKISSAMAKDYDMVCRWNGGPNAGHTVYLNDKKYKTHLIPSGVFHGKKSVIGPNCVLNVDKFLKEIEYLKENGFDTSLVKVHPNVHVITDAHIEYDLKHLKPKLGTTGQGIAPCYADKANRVGIQVKYLNFNTLKDFIWDGKLEGKILCEGAQSIWLDINYGDYPFVTSSETFPHNACSLGFSPKKIRDIIGVAKIYDTKSGVDPMFPETLWQDNQLNKIIELGEEYGSTTGRKRIVNWLNFGRLMSSINLSGSTKVIINKCDVLENLGVFRMLNFYETSIDFSNFEQMKKILKDAIFKGNVNGIKYENIIFSGDRTNI
jgi:adenylosuccinate synthase